MVPMPSKCSHLKHSFKALLKSSFTRGEAGKCSKSNVNQLKAHCCEDNIVIALQQTSDFKSNPSFQQTNAFTSGGVEGLDEFLRCISQ